MKGRQRHAGRCALIIALLGVAMPRVHQAQGAGGIGGSQPAVALLFFPTLNLTASVMDETRWTADARDAGSGHTVDFVTGHRDGGSFVLAVFQVEGATCPSLMNRELTRPGSRSVASPTYAPVPLDAPIVERDGLATFCKTVRGRATVFSFEPGTMTREQQLSLRLLAISMGITAVPGRVQSAGGRAGSVTDAVRNALPGRVHLTELQLMVPVLANSSWRASTYVAPSGARLDQLSVIGSDGQRLVVSVSRIDQAGTTCSAALDAFLPNQATIVPAPRWVPPDWHQQAAVTGGGSIACLPLASSLLLASVTPVAARDTSIVGLMLMGVRFAAIDTWGTP